MQQLIVISAVGTDRTGATRTTVDYDKSHFRIFINPFRA